MIISRGKDGRDAGHPDGFNKVGSHDLTREARLKNYRGFLYGSFNRAVLPWSKHLDEAAKIIDMIVDQSPDGLEVLCGSSTYVYDGNWKLQAKNGADCNIQRRQSPVHQCPSPAGDDLLISFGPLLGTSSSPF